MPRFMTALELFSPVPSESSSPSFSPEPQFQFEQPISPLALPVPRIRPNFRSGALPQPPLPPVVSPLQQNAPAVEQGERNQMKITGVTSVIKDKFNNWSFLGKVYFLNQWLNM